MITPEHFHEIFFTVSLSTRTTKRELRDYLKLTKTTLNWYLRYGVPTSKQFGIMDRLEVYLFENLGGEHEQTESLSS
jgi:hypothetical protein